MGLSEENCRVNTGPSADSPFWVSLVEHTRVEIWKESLLIVQFPRLCMLLPVAECAFSSSSAFVDGRLRYVAASSSFFASAWGFNHGHVGSKSQSTTPTSFLSVTILHPFIHHVCSLSLLKLLILTVALIGVDSFILTFIAHPVLSLGTAKGLVIGDVHAGK